jgi:hypothetical protein
MKKLRKKSKKASKSHNQSMILGVAEGARQIPQIHNSGDAGIPG